MSEVERFWSKVSKEGPIPAARPELGQCWPWSAYKGTGGYGRFCGAGRKGHPAHRYAWELVNGPVPPGLVMDHLCRNRACVNPSHLEPVTTGENTRRGLRSSHLREICARITHCPRGHEYTPENIYPRIYRKKYLGRICRTCHRERERQRWHENAAKRKELRK